MRALFCLLVFCAGAALAETDVEREARVAEIAAGLRCMVCQNQSIADSNADLAVDLRQQIREQLDAGRSDEEIRAYMAERYGDFILYQPPLKGSTWLLWVGPALLLIIGVIVLQRHLRGRRVDQTPLSAAEHERATSLLEDER
jgi:cytochrome c-type biogenesis protein CcmH